MRRSYYHYLMTLRNPNSVEGVANLANCIGEDLSFPKQSSSYDEISTYLETHQDYVGSLDVFDKSWELYVDNND